MMNRKRSHDDLEDADECLPISKRINSLHLEGKTQGFCQGGTHEGSRMLNGSFQASMMNEGSVAFPADLNHPSLIQHHEAVGRQMGASKFSHYDQRLYVHPEHEVATGSCTTSMPMGNFHQSQSFYASNANSVHPENQSFPCHNPHSRVEQQSNSGQFYSSQVPLGANEQMYMATSSGMDLINNNSHHFTNSMNCPPTALTDFGHHYLHRENLFIDNDVEELPKGPYEPELGVEENPHYYTTNKLLYEAHLSRLQRVVPDYQLHS